MGQGFDRSLWPGGRAFELPCCPGSRIFEFLCVPVTTNHFLGWGISVYFDLRVLAGGREFDSNCWENVKIPPYEYFLELQGIASLAGVRGEGTVVLERE